MKNYLFILILLSINKVYSQSSPVGLYGECNGPYSGYMCQQFLIEENGTFKFYDLLHLSGWSISEGKWVMKNDTIILNSMVDEDIAAYQITGKSNSDSVTFYVYSKDDTLGYAGISIDSIEYYANIDGYARAPKIHNQTFIFGYIGYNKRQIKFSESEIQFADTIKVELVPGKNGGHRFSNKKWLIIEDSIYHSLDSTNNYDRDRYFLKVPIQNLKYREDY
ncbi:hypothetical protein GYB57_11820 [bacterium]|nr:hypothetical protein [bacterium]